MKRETQLIFDYRLVNDRQSQIVRAMGYMPHTFA